MIGGKETEEEGGKEVREGKRRRKGAFREDLQRGLTNARPLSHNVG